jgi:uncharacterized protein
MSSSLICHTLIPHTSYFILHTSYFTKPQKVKIDLQWKAKEYDTLEHCILTITDTGTEADSVITGMRDNKIFRAEYRIKTNQHWRTKHVEIKIIHDGFLQSFKLVSNETGFWTKNDKPAEIFDGCIDVDLPITPFTNSLPINRLQLADKEQKQIKVIYLDLLNREIKPVSQKYTRLSKTKYHYENVPNDFEADIQVDELGLVVDYPGLFERRSMRTEV